MKNDFKSNDMRWLFWGLILCFSFSQAQVSSNYTSFFTGDTADYNAQPQGGACMMGGASEVDEAMQWFLNRADGGDVLVLRISGSDGYNNYLYSQLGITVNSVETIVFDDTLAAYDSYVLRRIDEAEAIWIPGGDQWDYISYWRNTPVETAIRNAVANRNVVFGGTSAGMALMGEYYFTAQNGTVTSSQALNNPLDNRITIDSDPFLSHPLLSNVITDTHFDNPDRKGRMVAFIADLRQNGVSTDVLGIALDEYTAICVNDSGMGRVYGSYPDFDDNAYFIRVNCMIPNNMPEQFVAGMPLEYNHGGEALSVYQVKGTYQGTHTFDLADGESGTGGEWKYWSASNGNISELNGNTPGCNTISQNELNQSSVLVYPNPSNGIVSVKNASQGQWDQVIVRSAMGEIVKIIKHYSNSTEIELDLSHVEDGVYELSFYSQKRWIHNTRLIIIH
jgi:cyanophycinase